MRHRRRPWRLRHQRRRMDPSCLQGTPDWKKGVVQGLAVDMEMAKTAARLAKAAAEDATTATADIDVGCNAYDGHDNDGRPTRLKRQGGLQPRRAMPDR